MWWQRVMHFFTAAHAAYLALAAVGIPPTIKYGWKFIMWLWDWRKRRREKAIIEAVKRLQNRAKEFLRQPNGNAIQSKTFWASVLDKPGLIDEALKRTAVPFYGLGPALSTQEELWEVDIGQELSFTHRESPKRRRG
jgi:hypothetical protein